MKNLIIIILAYTIILTAFSDLTSMTLEWIIPLNDRLEMIRTARVGLYINKKIEKKYDERNIINLTCYSIENDKSSVRGDFTVFMKDENGEVFKQIEKHITDFKIQKNGRYIVDKSLYIPNFRHMPTFPVKDIIPGEEWTAPAELIFTNFSTPFNLTFNVKYKFKELQNYEGREVAVVDYSFIMERSFNMQSVPIDFPLRIFGKNKGRLLWDIKGKKPHMMDDDYHVVFLQRVDASSIGSTEFIMKIATRNKMYPPVKLEDRNSAIIEIEKTLPKDSGISVDQDKRGIVLRLGEILFDFDSYRLKGEAEKNLEQVSDLLLKKYSDREVIVEGHTDNIGNYAYNQKLSEQRAHTVAKFLKNKGPLDKLSYRGYGEEKPIADNTSVDGRKKNRRVEVIINLK